MATTEEAINRYLEKLKDPTLTHETFVECTERIKTLRSLQETE